MHAKASIFLGMAVALPLLVVACDGRSGMSPREEAEVKAGKASTATLSHLTKVQAQSVRREIGATLGSADPTVLDAPPPWPSSARDHLAEEAHAHCLQLRQQIVDAQQQLQARAQEISNGQFDRNDNTLALTITQAKSEMAQACYDES